MHFLILLLSLATVVACGPTFAGIHEQTSTFSEIIKGQGNALDRMSEKDNFVSGFKMTDMITDIGISKSGILGLSALKSTNSMEIRWKRKSQALTEEKAELIVPADTDIEDFDHLTDTIADLAERSGKVAKSQLMKPQIKNALSLVHERISGLHVTQMNGWKFSGVRLDLNFSASGNVSYLASAGASFRVRLEWLVKVKPFIPSLNMNEETKIMAKILSDLNEAGRRVLIPGFEIKRLMLGFGSSAKKKFGIWKYSAGFVGGLIFVPVPVPPSFHSIPAEIFDVNLEVHGFEEEIVSREKWRLPWRRSYSVPVDFSKGIEQSIRMATSFTEQTHKFQFKNWFISEIKNVNDISKTGVFGLADVSARGLIEIDHKRVSK